MQKQKGKGAPATAGRLVEFTAAAHEFTEPGFEVSGVAGAAQITLGGGTIDIPANGYLRHIVLQVSAPADGGYNGNGFQLDGPWSALQLVEFLDVNGAPIVQLTGYSLFLANLFGGYGFNNDPRMDPSFVADDGDAGFFFQLRIPVEILHNNGLGALANMNSAAAYKCRLTLAPAASIWDGTPADPTVTVKGTVESWTLPQPFDLAGRAQAQLPPRHGTTQYHSSQIYTINNGDNRVRLTRTGSLYKCLIGVLRDTNGDRSDSMIPDPLRVQWDQREITNEPLALRRWLGASRGFTEWDSSSALIGAAASVKADAPWPVGVVVFDYSHDVLNKAGDGTPELFIPTLQQTRWEWVGTFGAAGTLEVITVDVAPVEENQALRYEEKSATGFRPGVVMTGA